MEKTEDKKDQENKATVKIVEEKNPYTRFVQEYIKNNEEKIQAEKSLEGISISGYRELVEELSLKTRVHYKPKAKVEE